MALTRGSGAGELPRDLGSGKDSGLKRIRFTHPEEPGGVAARTVLGEEFAEGGSFSLMLGADGSQDGLDEHVEIRISAEHTYAEVNSSATCSLGGGRTQCHRSRRMRVPRSWPAS